MYITLSFFKSFLKNSNLTRRTVKSIL